MKRSLFTSYLRFETFCSVLVLGLGGVAFAIRAATHDSDSMFYSLIAGAVVVTAACLLFRAARRL